MNEAKHAEHASMSIRQPVTGRYAHRPAGGERRAALETVGHRSRSLGSGQNHTHQGQASTGKPGLKASNKRPHDHPSVSTGASELRRRTLARRNRWLDVELEPAVARSPRRTAGAIATHDGVVRLRILIAARGVVRAAYTRRCCPHDGSEMSNRCIRCGGLDSASCVVVILIFAVPRTDCKPPIELTLSQHPIKERILKVHVLAAGAVHAASTSARRRMRGWTCRHPCGSLRFKLRVVLHWRGITVLTAVRVVQCDVPSGGAAEWALCRRGRWLRRRDGRWRPR